MIRRFSSRRERLDTSFLNDRLKGAHAYDRIAGYFSSSILEVAGENLDQITGTVRMVCNSQLDAMDVKTDVGWRVAVRYALCENPIRGMSTETLPETPRLPDIRQTGSPGSPRRGLRPDPRQGRHHHPRRRHKGKHPRWKVPCLPRGFV